MVNSFKFEKKTKFFSLAFHLLIGGSLIGVGMVLAGSCPGTIFVQM